MAGVTKLFFYGGHIIVPDCDGGPGPGQLYNIELYDPDQNDHQQASLCSRDHELGTAIITSHATSATSLAMTTFGDCLTGPVRVVGTGGLGGRSGERGGPESARGP